MLNMIKAELYKTGRRAYPKIFLLVVLGGIIALNLLIYIAYGHAGEKVMKDEMLMMYLACLVAVCIWRLLRRIWYFPMSISTVH